MAQFPEEFSLMVELVCLLCGDIRGQEGRFLDEAAVYSLAAVSYRLSAVIGNFTVPSSSRLFDPVSLNLVGPGLLQICGLVDLGVLPGNGCGAVGRMRLKQYVFLISYFQIGLFREQMIVFFVLGM